MQILSSRIFSCKNFTNLFFHFYSCLGYLCFLAFGNAAGKSVNEFVPTGSLPHPPWQLNLFKLLPSWVSGGEHWNLNHASAVRMGKEAGSSSHKKPLNSKSEHNVLAESQYNQAAAAGKKWSANVRVCRWVCGRQVHWEKYWVTTNKLYSMSYSNLKGF